MTMKEKTDPLKAAAAQGCIFLKDLSISLLTMNLLLELCMSFSFTAD